MATARLRRLGVIARTDIRLRLRRPATLWTLAILCGLAYSIIPDPASGRALLVLGDARAQYSSTTIALVTATLASMLLSFAGFYLTSNGIRRDLLARTGPIIAAAPVASADYLVGKFLGASGYLATVVGIYLVNILLMHFLRGEAALEPLTYLAIYLVTLGPVVLVIAAIALCFECLPVLAGRAGDLLYVVLWAFMLASGAMSQGGGVLGWLDIPGIGFALQVVRAGTGSTQISMGMVNFDPAQPTWVLPAIPWSIGFLLPRLGAMLVALPFLLLAWLGFHRFDPARVRVGPRPASAGLLGRLDHLLRPATGHLTTGLSRLTLAAPNALRPVLVEANLTVALRPVGLLVLAGLSIGTIVAAEPKAMHLLLPLLVAGIGALLADLSTRDRANGTQSMLFSAPRIRSSYAAIKFAAGALIGMALILPPAARLGLTHPAAAVSLAIGVMFVAAAATAFGLLTHSPKAFMAVFLLFFYLVLNGGGVPALDFGGWNGVATWGTRAGYAVLTLLMLGVAEGCHRRELARRW
ncbi:MAG: hypothetical protein ABI587_14760 [Gemmatimonadales bacterium]